MIANGKKFKIAYTNWNTNDGSVRIDYIRARNAIEALMDYQAENDVKVVKVEEEEVEE